MSIFSIKDFDSVTKFRLLNTFIVSIGMGLIAPVITILKGTLLPVWMISMFGILNTLSVKTNQYFSKKSITYLYRLGVIIHLGFVLGALLYFWSPMLMIVIDTSLVIAEIAIFSAYGIRLNTYITDFYPDAMHQFQIHRNNIWADGSLIGLGTSALITTIYGIPGMIIAFVVFNTLFSIWMLINWNFYQRKNL